MPCRLYAISFLGIVSFRDGIIPLLKIIEDDKVNEEFRAAALLSIFQIEERRGDELAKKYISDKTYLGKMAAWIQQKHPLIYEKRSYMEAYFHWDS